MIESWGRGIDKIVHHCVDEGLAEPIFTAKKPHCVMGKMKVVREAHQDPTTADERWVSVTFEPVESFAHPISLNQLKSTKGLENIGLVKQPRLAVMKLEKVEYEKIISIEVEITLKIA